MNPWLGANSQTSANDAVARPRFQDEVVAACSVKPLSGIAQKGKCECRLAVCFDARELSAPGPGRVTYPRKLNGHMPFRFSFNDQAEGSSNMSPSPRLARSLLALDTVRTST